MNSRYKLLLETETELGNISKVSTFDHIFSSIPIRIIDGHHSFLGKSRGLRLFLWDINHPTEKRYKTELAPDGVFLNTNSNKYYLYEENKPYYASAVKSVDLELLKREFIQSIDFVFGKDLKTKLLLIERYSEILNVYSKNFNKHNEIGQFYIALLTDFYNLLGFTDLSELVNSHMISLYRSGVITRLIPKLIKETADMDCGYLALLRSGKQMFQPPYFRRPEAAESVGNEYLNADEVEKNIDEVCKLIAQGSLLPSQTIVSWALAMCGVEHYGNDHGFFAELASCPGGDEYAQLQRTKPKMDGINFIEFDNNEVFSYKLIGDKAQRSVNNPARSMNFICAYLHLGREGLIDACRRWWESGELTKISFGKIQP